MSIDNEILQEFLIEAGELFDQLNDQFSELEKSPDDIDIINAIFRAYHTIKGGAGFMKLMPMVEVCHRAEDAINQLRQGERQVTDELIDVMFQTLDELDDMFSCVRAGDELTNANADLLQQLDALLAQSTPQNVTQQSDGCAVMSMDGRYFAKSQEGGAIMSRKDGHDRIVAQGAMDGGAIMSRKDGISQGAMDGGAINEQKDVEAVMEHADTVVSDPDDSNPAEQNMDDEFEAMLANNKTANEADNDDNKHNNNDSARQSDLITDDEFDAVLDQLHGKGNHKVVIEKSQPKTDTDLISDDEFEAVLDNLHGKGKHGSVTETGKPTVVKEQNNDLITDEEFEAALDQLHGQGKGPSATLHQNTTITEHNNLSTLPVETKDTKQSGGASQKKPVANKKNKAKKAAEKKPQAESTIRVDTARLDDIMNLVGELALVRNRLTTLKQETKNVSLSDAISTLELVSSELQSSVMKTRMQPIKKVFSRFPRVIRDLARKLKKDINLELIGEETDLDKSLVEALADPLIHLVRNAADHGIESPQDRFESGKERQGKVTLSAKQEGDQILITVSDDGKGMDHNVLRQKAVEKGMMSEEAADNLTEKEAYNLIFAAGFSTATEVSDVSGRGVGMDVVKTRINELNGNVEIDSKLGEGSVISIYLPLTLAILPTLMVRLKQYQFALPLSNVLEAFNMQPDQINVVDGHEVIRVRDNPLPLFYLSPWLVRDEHFSGPETSQKVIVVQMGNRRFCLVVDHIAGQEEVVIKPLGKMLNNTRGFSGATITGDGSIALIIDVPSLLTAYAANSTVY